MTLGELATELEREGVPRARQHLVVFRDQIELPSPDSGNSRKRKVTLEYDALDGLDAIVRIRPNGSFSA